MINLIYTQIIITVIYHAFVYPDTRFANFMERLTGSYRAVLTVTCVLTFNILVTVIFWLLTKL